MRMDAPRKIVLVSNAVVCALILAYAATPWHTAGAGLVTFVCSVLVVSGLSLALALRQHRSAKMASAGQHR
jgi:type IV secretory pathway TrbD component